MRPVSKEPSSELERVREESLRRLRGGKLPVEAQRRLQALGARPGWTPGAIQEMRRATEAWNAARGIALRRLRLEAAECGADAVVGVHIEHGEKEYAGNSVEFTALGTAVRVPAANQGASRP
jgi:hypothetical protein